MRSEAEKILRFITIMSWLVAFVISALLVTIPGKNVLDMLPINFVAILFTFGWWLELDTYKLGDSFLPASITMACCFTGNIVIGIGMLMFK